MLIIVGFILVAIVAVRLWVGFFPVPMGLRHLVNSAIAPKEKSMPAVFSGGIGATPTHQIWYNDNMDGC